MGPSSFDDGDRTRWACLGGSRKRFNGAVVLRRRRLRHTCDHVQPATLLQWGRRPSTTETLADAELRSLLLSASMGPSSFDDGDDKAGAAPEQISVASIGPSSFDDGDRANPV